MMMNERDDTQFERRNENEKYHFRKRLIGSVVLTMLIVAMVTGFHHQGSFSPAHKSHLVLEQGKAIEKAKEMEKKNIDGLGTSTFGKIHPFHGVGSDIFNGKSVPHPRFLFPYYVAIYHMDHMASGPFCGGVLIRWDLVLTAAHCLANERKTGYLSARRLALYAGFTGIQYPNMGVNHQVKFASYIVKYNSYNWIGFGNDIGLIKLEDGGFAPRHGMVALAPLAPSTAYPPTNRKVVLTGTGPVGVSGGNKIYPRYLRRGYSRVTNWADCRALYPQALDGNRNFCVTDVNYGICKGDSGSPIIDDTTKQVIGIITRGSQTCDSALPGVGLFIGAYARWIKTTRESIEAGVCTGGTRLWLRND